MHVWTVTLFSSGERWHTFVCATSEIAADRLHARRMTREYGDHDSEYQDYRDHSDISQTAMVVRCRVIEK